MVIMTALITTLYVSILVTILIAGFLAFICGDADHLESDAYNNNSEENLNSERMFDMNEVISSVNNEVPVKTVTERDLEKQVCEAAYEAWCRNTDEIKEYTEWLNSLSNKLALEKAELSELTDPDNPDSPLWRDMI